MIDEKGYTVEIRIPFSSIRFNPESDTWGMNISRSIPRKNERVFWQPVRRADFFYRPSRAGSLVGFEGLKPKRKVDYIPYIGGTFRSIRAVPEGSGPFERRNTFRPAAGIDIKIPLSSSLVADVTINPDFGQTEADVEDVSSSRFEIFLPEKREFFTEGSDIFRTPIQLFFTRRVGQRLADGVEQQIAGGVRLTGQFAGFRVGLLEAMTLRRAYLHPTTGQPEVAPAANFFVLRLQRNVLSRSSIGFITVNRDQTQAGLFDPARAHGIDFNLISGQNITWSSQIAFSQNPPQPDLIRDPTGKTLKKYSPWLSRALSTNFRYNSNLWEYSVQVSDIGEGFNVSQIGFSPITNRLSYGGSIEYKPRIERSGMRQLFIQSSFNGSSNHQRQLETQEIGSRLRVQLKNFWNVFVFADSSKERFYEFYEGVDPAARMSVRRRFDGVSQDVDGNALPERYRYYNTSGWGAGIRTPFSREFSWGVVYRQADFIDFNDNFHGRSRSLNFNVDTRIGENLRLELNASVIRDYFDDGRPQETRGLFMMRAVYLFTKDLRLRSLIQYNVAARRLSINTLFYRQFTARSGFGIGYDDSFSGIGGFAPLDRQFYFKISHLF